VKIPDAYRGREQSYIKHYFLREYLERVLFVTQSPYSRFSEFIYVDGFSGPWKSQAEDYADTSFAIAIERLRVVREKYKSIGHAVKIRCCFVEESTAFEELQAIVDLIKDIEIQIFHGRFEDLVPEILKWIGGSSSTFVLTFVDPTGWSVDLAAIAPLLARRPGEVIYNFMYSFLRRFPTHPDPKIRLSYELPLGKEWQTKLDPARGFDDAVIALFTQELKNAGRFQHVLKVTVLKPTTDAPHFYLFYGTRHRTGVIEFRKVQRSTSAAQAAVRYEARAVRREVRAGQSDLFRAAGLDEPVDDQVEHQQELDRVRMALRSFVEDSRAVRFERVVDHLLVNHEITEREVQTLLNAERLAGRIQIEGMNPRERLPKNGYLIRAMSH
jgi:three-Cys-motif partner protein